MQWFNPKAWAACTSGTTLFSEPSTSLPLILFIIIYFFICYISLSIWAIFGDKMSTFLQGRAQMRIFNLLMGGVLCVIACYMLYPQ